MRTGVWSDESYLHAWVNTGTKIIKYDGTASYIYGKKDRYQNDMTLTVDDNEPMIVPTTFTPSHVPALLLTNELDFGDHTIKMEAKGKAVGTSYVTYYGLSSQH